MIDKMEFIERQKVIDLLKEHLADTKLFVEIACVPITLIEEDGLVSVLRDAFSAGIEYASDCNCGQCDYCISIKSGDAPDFETWYKSLPQTKEQ